MLMSDYDYELPPELIAQTAAEPRDSSRLQVLDREHHTVTHRPSFRSILEYLRPGDALVVNESKVIPARVYGRKAGTGGQVELLLLRPAPQEMQTGESGLQPTVWEALVRPGRGMRPGATLIFGPAGDELGAEVVGEAPSGGRYIAFSEAPLPFLDRHGEMPLPPYIHQRPADQSRYQTVYANPGAPGSAAAPTAGLHFTSDLLEEVVRRGVSLERVLLHVGLDTFQPVKEENALEHKMHSEWCNIDAATAARLNTTREQGGRVIAVGTTAVRTLETAYNPESNRIEGFAGETRLFLYPGKQLKAIDALITNFHLPRSTLLLLVSAFAGREFMLQAYNEAVQERYRFFSFGDAMFIF
ncbi:MAG TPA: tRNA preQ1(34) S-adenosylmethionine ribosyltransferase-isomerase QueA [Chloroflexia bacterium]|nr:tRNA preQ1(34) S-adenosylmethionine ribosyltransferase-isomerase QueA [Chloroflexia bacterium]